MYMYVYIYHGFHKIIRTVSSALNQHIIIISEGSCDTEDWSNDAEDSYFPAQK